MLKTKIKFGTLLPLFFFLLATAESMASHIAAGDITARRVDCFSTTFEFTIRGYENLETKQVDFGNGIINFGDGDTLRLNPSMFTRININDRVDMMVITLRHTYSGNQSFRVSYEEDFRPPGVRNISGSGNVPFYVETLVRLDPFLGCNNSPVFSIPPIDQGGVAVAFYHNSGAYDPDGDSLSYRLITPLSTFGVNVPGYEFPHRVGPNPINEAGNGPATFEMNPVTGELIWDAPTYQGIYNVAFVVEEWRELEGEYFLMGYVMRDMQIYIEDTDNNPPVIEALEEICIEAGETLMEIVRASDPDGHQVKLEAFGEPFNISPSATFSNTPPVFNPSPDEQQFIWETSCELVRADPYVFDFKVTDQAPVSFARFASTRVIVVAPAPQNLTADGRPGRSIELSWDAYFCDNASSMQIWRKVGGFDFAAEECEVGIPASAGYELVANVPIGNTSYLDTNGGIGLNFGANYCYRLVAEFPLPRGGKSYASEEVCFEINATGPIITNVDVESTSENNGEVYVKWQQPYEIDEVTYPGPYMYKLFRASGLNGDEPSQLIAITSDTTFTDSGLNTAENAYRYMVEIYDANTDPETGEAVEKSAVASTVWLAPISRLRSVELRWSARVPWSNVSQDYPMHYIYRDRVSNIESQDMVLIDSVDVSQDGLVYVDSGQFNDTMLSDELIYRYFVTTQGTYGNPLIEEPLINKSQIAGIRPTDTIPPCPPIAVRFSDFESEDNCLEYLSGRPCDFNDFQNELSWSVNEADECTQETEYFEIWFSDSLNEGDFTLVGTTTSTSFIHRDLSSFKGCYQIAAVDRSGNVSAFSELICKDNCPNIIFPNVFTPNDDQINDVFAPLSDRFIRNNSGGEEGEGNAGVIQNFDYANCPRFVKDIDFRVFDRYGALVFSYNSANSAERNYHINWTGVSNDGRKLPAATYYYEAIVTFDVLDPDNAKQQYKGWVQLQR